MTRLLLRSLFAPVLLIALCAAISAQVIEERRRELFLDGHRLNDVLRLNLPFDTGTTFKGVPYGDTKCLPLPDAERLANPNFTP